MHYDAPGYCLLELSIFLLLLGIVCSAAMPHREEGIRSLEQLSLRVEQLLEHTRAAAFQTKHLHVVQIEADRMHVVTHGRTVDALVIEDLFEFSGTHSQFTFTPTGTASPGRIRIRSRRGHCDLRISLFGRSTRTCQKT